jgi:hypothetical protein
MIKSRTVGWALHMHGEYETYKSEGKRTTSSWEDNTEMDMRIWTGFIWLRTESSGGLMCTW